MSEEGVPQNDEGFQSMLSRARRFAENKSNALSKDGNTAASIRWFVIVVTLSAIIARISTLPSGQ